MLSVMAAIPLVTLSVGSVPTFAQSPTEVSKNAAASPIGLTSAQKSQAARVARQTEHINTTSGYVSVSSTALAEHGLNSRQIAYVQETVHRFDTHLNLSFSSTSVSPAPLNAPPNATIWDTHAQFTGQYVMLFEGAQPGWGWAHMQCRHNWNIEIAQANVEKNRVWRTILDTTRHTYIYNHWWNTTVPFRNFYVLMQVVVNGGNTTRYANSQGKGPGAVITAYPIYGNYKSAYRCGKPNSSLVPWWINDGYYTWMYMK